MLNSQTGPGNGGFRRLRPVHHIDPPIHDVCDICPQVIPGITRGNRLFNITDASALADTAEACPQEQDPHAESAAPHRPRLARESEA